MAKLPSFSVSTPLSLVAGFILGILFSVLLMGPLFSLLDSNSKCKEYLDSRGLSSYTSPTGESLLLKSGSCKYEETPVGKYTSGEVEFTFVLGTQEGTYKYVWTPGLPGTTTETITIPSFQTTNKELFEVVRSNKCGYFSYLASLYFSTPDLQSRYSSAASTCLSFNASAEDADGAATFTTTNGASYVFTLN